MTFGYLAKLSLGSQLVRDSPAARQLLGEIAAALGAATFAGAQVVAAGFAPARQGQESARPLAPAIMDEADGDRESDRHADEQLDRHDLRKHDRQGNENDEP